MSTAASTVSQVEPHYGKTLTFAAANPVTVRNKMRLFSVSRLSTIKIRSDTGLVFIFIRGVDKSYEVYEELLDIDSIHGTTNGADIFKRVENAISKISFDGKT